ncbi:MAG: type II toxin-antitoxin system RelE/ParE family toxin [Myxococcales bacterium]|nr:type II toxin-antitoxin system RelE/ParE family toxin [Myxococcales bacterium]
MQIQLTNAADRDIEEILDFGIDRFGVEQALRYIDGLKLHLDRLIEHPMRYPTMDHIRPGYRRSVFGVHSIYFRAEPDLVLVVRVLRSQSPGPALVEGETS